MNAHAHLTGLGWRGSGHSLDSTDRGLKKPLLISHKYNNHGLGSKAQKEKQADQWWLSAFDSALKDIGSGRTSQLDKVRDKGIGGLYGNFVRGQLLEGTIGIESTSSGIVTPVTSETPEASNGLKKSKSKKRKLDDAAADATESDSKRLRKEKKALRKAAKLADATANDAPTPVDSAMESSISGVSTPIEHTALIWDPSMLGDRSFDDLTKEERKARRIWKRERKAQKAQRSDRTNEDLAEPVEEEMMKSELQSLDHTTKVAATKPTEVESAVDKKTRKKKRKDR